MGHRGPGSHSLQLHFGRMQGLELRGASTYVNIPEIFSDQLPPWSTEAMNQWALCGSLSLLKLCSIRTLLQRPTMDLLWQQWWQHNTTRVCAIPVPHVLHSTHLCGYGTGGNITLKMEYNKYHGCCFQRGSNDTFLIFPGISCSH